MFTFKFSLSVVCAPLGKLHLTYFQILSLIYGNGFEIVKVNKVFHLNPILQKKRCQILPTVALVVCWSKHCANVFVLLCLLSTNCHSLLFQKVHVLKQH